MARKGQQRRKRVWLLRSDGTDYELRQITYYELRRITYYVLRIKTNYLLRITY